MKRRWREVGRGAGDRAGPGLGRAERLDLADEMGASDALGWKSVVPGTKLVGSIPGQATYRNQPTSKLINKWDNTLVFLSLSLTNQLKRKKETLAPVH